MKIPRLEQVLTFRNFTLATKLGVAGEKTDQRVGTATKKGQETGKVMGAAGVLVFWGFRAGEEALQRAPNLPRHTNK